MVSEFALSALMLKQKKARKRWSDDLNWKFQKILYSCIIFIAMLSYIIVFAFTYVLENIALLYGEFRMNSYSVAMKRWSKAMKR
jgi:hypothetical protein